MKPDKLQKRILVFLLILCLLTPTGILLPMFLNAGDAWGEWSAQTLKDLIGYVPHGLEKYSGLWKSPLPGYNVISADLTVIHKSGFYIVSSLFGATVTYAVMFFVSRLIIRNGK